MPWRSRAKRRHLLATIGFTLAALATSVTTSGATPTPHQRASAYLAAVDYLRAAGAEAWRSTEGQPVLLAEAIAGDALVAGPRSTTQLAALDLRTLDALGRRAWALSQLSIDTAPDTTALLDELSLLRPGPLSLAGTAARNDPDNPKFGSAGTRVPYALDNALALQGLAAAGVPTDDTIQDALVYLLERQIPATEPDEGAWSYLEHEHPSGEHLVGDVGTTAQVVLALSPYDGFTFTIPIDPSLGINTDIAAALSDAVTFLKAATPTRASEWALLILALLQRDPTAPEIGDALDELLLFQDQSGGGLDGSFDQSEYATALAARSFLRASAFAGFEFDTDNDGTFDGPDSDRDGDGFCDPGESGGCTGVDLFPFNPLIDSDLDNDGIGDGLDPDKDGDGVPDANESTYEEDAQESADADGDGLADTEDPDDDNDGLNDVRERLNGLDPNDPDSDDDGYNDHVEVALGTDGLNAGDFPVPDGDIFPLGAPDGVVDIRDILLARRILLGLETPPPLSQDEGLRFLWHADVSPLAGGTPAPDGAFGLGDLLVIRGLVAGSIASW